MNDAEIRRLERARDLEPCRETLEALDAARARRGDGPWLPATEHHHRAALTGLVTTLGGTWEWMGSWLRRIVLRSPALVLHADEARMSAIENYLRSQPRRTALVHFTRELEVQFDPLNEEPGILAGLVDAAAIEGWTVDAPWTSQRLQ